MTENTMDVLALPPDQTAALSQTLAMVSDEPTPPDVAPVVMTARGGRIFAPEQEPLADGVAYTALDGGVFFRPTWRVADRPAGLVAGPDVAFDRDSDGAIRLRCRLTQVRPPGVPESAGSLLIGIGSVTLAWHGGSEAIDLPAAEPDLALVLPLLPERARAVELAMSDAASGCRLDVVHTLHYRVPVPAQPTTPPPVAVFDDRYAGLALKLREQGYHCAPVQFDGATWWVVVFDEPDLDQAMARLAAEGIGWPTAQDLSRMEGPLREVLGDRYDEIVGQPLSTAEREEYQQVSQAVPFVFNPNDDANRPVYRALHGVANLTDTWQKSAAGWLRAAPFPNTVYRLPDEVRLAFDPDLGTPHVVTTLHTDDQGRSSVRVLLRVAPWQDPRKIVETRALTGADAATVIVGPVAGATLRLGGSFPDGIRILGDPDGAGAGGVAVPLAEGADLLMDLSLEYFQLLCGMLGGTVGLPGTVEVRLDDAITVSVPVSLRMDRVDDLPVGVEVLPASGPPTAVRLSNRAGTAIRAGGCAAVFLWLESRSVVPLASHPARCTTAFPLELAAGATAELAFEPIDRHDGDRWNAVLVELLDKAMVDDAEATLLRAQQLAGTGELTWELTVSTPLFNTPALPSRWAELASIEVEVAAPGFETTAVILRRDTPSRTITMRKPLAALVSGGAAGIRTATYRIRNNYLDHQGRWSAPQQQAGEELVVFPNPVTPD